MKLLKKTESITQVKGVLVSYSRGDERWVKNVLVGSLRKQRFVVWWDRESNFPGTNYRFQFEKAVNACGAFILVLSKEAIERKETGYWEEYHRAKARYQKLIPGHPFIFVVWREAELEVPKDEVRPGETLDQLGRVELWGHPSDAKEEIRLRQEFGKLVAQLRKVATQFKPRVEMDLRSKTDHRFWSFKFSVGFWTKIFLIALLFPVFVIALPLLASSILDAYSISSLTEYFFGIGIIAWIFSGALLMTRVNKGRRI